ncbi:MAG: hypothetical protein ACRDY2_07680 [Acidimicrobiales bacterium]
MTVIGCTGHQNLPGVAQDYVARCIRSEIEGHGEDNLTGVCSLAMGADQMFAQLVLEAGGTLHAIIPCAGYELTFSTEGRASFDSLLGLAAKVETLGYSAPSEDAFLSAGYRVADLADVLIAVWDGQAARGLGGTADVVDYARRRAGEVVILWPEGVRR